MLHAQKESATKKERVLVVGDSLPKVRTNLLLCAGGRGGLTAQRKVRLGPHVPVAKEDVSALGGVPRLEGVSKSRHNLSPPSPSCHHHILFIHTYVSWKSASAY
ncbi:hypothetical protein ColLi_12693 [Colletotrichum liriopes]|uniref:Uncharacterized protein n=1 Tax=Colletotrichum liriopes TaxID=708192 RepID=A0AA37GYV3_9PEZI|nr:hypothetical protein ColLi_12693 [Colletotrichum liriopes]